MSDTANPNLIDLLDAVLVALPDDVARRRWGRGLDYFRDLAGRVVAPSTSILVQDIFEFLDDRSGLKKAPGERPVALESAVLRLEEECARIFRDEPVAAFTIGTIDGGHAPQGPPVHDFARKLRESDVVGADFSINVVFPLAGTKSKPNWSGVHGGHLHPGRRGMVINAAPPEGVVGAELDRFLAGAMEEAVVRTERSLKRHHLDWSTLPHRTIPRWHRSRRRGRRSAALRALGASSCRILSRPPERFDPEPALSLHTELSSASSHRLSGRLCRLWAG